MELSAKKSACATCGFPAIPLPGRPGVRACVYMHGLGVVRKHERPINRRPSGKRRAQHA